MASEVKTNKISPSTLTTVTLGDASDVFQLPASAEIDIASGATLDVNGTIDLTGATTTGFPSGGKIGQVFQGKKTDTFTTDATTWIDIPDLTVDITPAATSSKILVMMCVVGNGKPAASSAVLRIVRDSTAIGVADAAGSRIQATSSIYTGEYYGVQAGVMTWLDEPGLDVAITYKIQGFCSNPTNTMHINRFTTDTDGTDIPRTVSTITVMEYLA